MQQFKNNKEILNNSINDLERIIERMKENKSYKEDEKIKTFLDKNEILISELKTQINIDIFIKNKMFEKSNLHFSTNEITELKDFLNNKIVKSIGQKKGDKEFNIMQKINYSKQAFKNIIILKKEEKILNDQYSSLKMIYESFVAKQRNELKAFVEKFSIKINDYYKYMNLDENISNITMETIESDTELRGITMEYTFCGGRESPPQKYLSESHLNSLGIAFYLSSVRAFNKENKFIVLDDIVSSFDSPHRARLAKLLKERFNDFQLIVLTHEKTWYELMKYMIKGDSKWQYNEIKWTEERGSFIEENITELSDIIEDKISNNIIDSLGNDIRKYLEKTLKEICINFEVLVKYLPSDKNEKRMCEELLMYINKAIKEQPSKKEFCEKIITRIIGNLNSHYNDIDLKMGDFIAFWQDVNDFIKQFKCPDCNKYLSVHYYDNVNRKIRCKCGKRSYDWKI